MGILFVFIVSSIYDKSRHKQQLFQIITILSAFFILIIGWLELFLPILLVLSLNHIGVSSIASIIDNLASKVSDSIENVKNIGFGSMRLFGISNVISVLISGVVFDNFGGRLLYLMSAVGCLAPLIFSITAPKDNSNLADQNGAQNSFFYRIS